MRHGPGSELKIGVGVWLSALLALLAAIPTSAFAADPHPDRLWSGPKGFAPTMALTRTGDDAVVSFADLMLEKTVPKAARRLYEKALKFERQGKLEQAMQEAQSAVEVAPEFFQAHAALAVGYLNAGAFEEAEVHAEMALGFNPEYIPARHIQGLVLFFCGKYREAANTLSEVLKHAPERKTAHYFLGLALRQLGDEQEAGQHLERAGELLRKPDPRLDWLRGISRGWPPWNGSSSWRRFSGRDWR